MMDYDKQAGAPDRSAERTAVATDMRLHPYLFFGGKCEEALRFYGEALGAEVEMMMRYKDSPDPPPPGKLPAGYDTKIMHAQVRIGDLTVMASDGVSIGASYSGFALSLTVRSVEEVNYVFDALGEDGQVTMPLTKTFWSPRFGMVTDRFGIGWMVSVAG